MKKRLSPWTRASRAPRAGAVALVVVCHEVLAVEECRHPGAGGQLERLLEDSAAGNLDLFAEHGEPVHVETKHLDRVGATGRLDGDPGLHAPGPGRDREVGDGAIGVGLSNGHEPPKVRGAVRRR